MLPAPPARLLRRIVPIVPFVLYGCSDAAVPVAPRFDARPHTLEAPVITVTNTDDSGPGSLRQAIADASATPGTVIHFDPAVAGETILLSSQLQVGSAITIEGPLPEGITISGNLSTRVFEVGGAPANLVLRNLSIVNGRAASGGGMQIMQGGVALLDHVLVANNEAADDGGGISAADPSDLTLVNTTISGNVARLDGGAIRSDGSVTMRNSTIAFNVASDGGGLFLVGGLLSMRNTILSNNIDSDPATTNLPNCRAKILVITLSGHNITNEDPCANDPSIIITEPRLGPLASNGGPTMTHALGAESPAIDFGISCTEATDQRYVARPQGTTCDVGAFEFNDFGSYTITLGPNVAVSPKTGIVTLTGTIACSKPATQVELAVTVSQTQKTTGRFTTIVHADGVVNVSSCGPGPTAWSAPLTPASGKFEQGSATGTATTGATAGFLPASVTSPLKVFQVK